MDFIELFKNNPGVILALTAFAAFMLGYLVKVYIGKSSIQSAEKMAKKIVEDGRLEAKNILGSAKQDVQEELKKSQINLEDQYKSKHKELDRIDKRLSEKQGNLEKRSESVNKKEGEVQAREKMLKEKTASVELEKDSLQESMKKHKDELSKMSSLTQEEAKKAFMEKVQVEFREETVALHNRIEESVREEAHTKARWVVAEAMHRVAIDYVKETTTTTVHLANDEIKGKIIGREGRNIRTFENCTGVDLIVDDTPEVVVLSAFDMLRREIARIALERLIIDGRIHPVRIEEVVEKVRQELDETIEKRGQNAILELKLQGLHPDLIKLIGRLKYRTSYGQNVLSHSIEVAWLMGVMASEMGLDPVMARRMGLLHDIGKARSHEVEGPHAIIGGAIAKKLGEDPDVVHAINAHHEEIEARNVYAMLLQAADAISAARPGARSDTVERYVNRLQDLENAANDFPGVERTYAIQAGRELRVIVKPEEIDDAQAINLSRQIAKKIQSQLEYPGVIRVTVVRESRAVGFAR